MATVTITIPNAQATRVLTAVCAVRSYTGFLADGVTPETQAQFVERTLAAQIKDWVRSYEIAQAAATAAASVDAEITPS